jgi:hypothetical protein
VEDFRNDFLSPSLEALLRAKARCVTEVRQGDLLAVRGNLPALGPVTHNRLVIVQVDGQEALVEQSNGLCADIGAICTTSVRLQEPMSCPRDGELEMRVQRPLEGGSRTIA